eukprot:TRINITY_DN401_c0_g2_i2.p2 TRINITY_DN401_c0_g2~~TRINITY_DN401_c0_g2_i2.p2  ORF type:complete len:303 (+),score=78.01 TRINITY_DN401_c0_g2_i2:51-959(+)
MSHFEQERMREQDRHQQIAGFLGNNLAAQTGSPQRDTLPPASYAAPISAAPQSYAAPPSQYAMQPPPSHPASPQRERTPFQSAAPMMSQPYKSAAPMPSQPFLSAAPVSAVPMASQPMASAMPMESQPYQSQYAASPPPASVPTGGANGYFEEEKAKEESRHQQIAQFLGDNLAAQTGSPRRGSPQPAQSAYPTQSVIVGANPSQPVYDSPVKQVSYIAPQSAAPVSYAAPVSAMPQQSYAQSAAPVSYAAPVSAMPQQSYAAPVSYGSPTGAAPALPLTGQPGEGESPRRLKAWGESCSMR